MSDWRNWGPYVSVAEKKRRAEKKRSQLEKRGKKVDPVIIEGRKISHTFWGDAWCTHLESFSDYANRLPRGRSYVRNGSVLHLDIKKGEVEALVQGSSLYKVKIKIAPLSQKKWEGITQSCSGKIDSLVELLQGRLSKSVMEMVTDQRQGLFPGPKAISLSCSCPDWAEMCKHVAAVLYGVGSRLDRSPELLFLLRQVDHLQLITAAQEAPIGVGAKNAKILENDQLEDVFGIRLQAQEPIAKPKKTVAKKKLVSKRKKVP